MEPTAPAGHHHPLRAGLAAIAALATASGLSPSAAAVGMSGRDLRRLVAIAVGR